MPRLTETSYIVLGLVEQAQPATPYALKRLAEFSTSYFWTVPHTQLYSECARLAGEGLLDESRERDGRRRRTYRLTERGAELLEAWQRALATGDKEQITATRLAYDSLPQPKRCPREKRSALMKARWASYTPQQREERIRKSYEGRHGERLVA